MSENDEPEYVEDYIAIYSDPNIYEAYRDIDNYGIFSKDGELTLQILHDYVTADIYINDEYVMSISGDEACTVKPYNYIKNNNINFYIVLLDDNNSQTYSFGVSFDAYKWDPPTNTLTNYGYQIASDGTSEYLTEISFDGSINISSGFKNVTNKAIVMLVYEKNSAYFETPFDAAYLNSEGTGITLRKSGNLVESSVVYNLRAQGYKPKLVVYDVVSKGTSLSKITYEPDFSGGTWTVADPIDTLLIDVDTESKKLGFGGAAPSADEDADIRFHKLVDFAGGATGVSNSVTYQLGEVDTGSKWYDGNAIYRWCYASIVSGSGNDITFGELPRVPKRMISCNGWITYTAHDADTVQWRPINYSSTSSLNRDAGVRITGQSVILNIGSSFASGDKIVTLILEYT